MLGFPSVMVMIVSVAFLCSREAKQLCDAGFGGVCVARDWHAVSGALLYFTCTLLNEERAALP